MFSTDGDGLLSPTTANQTYQRPFDESAIILSGVIIFTLFFVGIVLNSITIAVITRSPQLKNIFMCFIVSLCCSDLISALISPLFWYRRTLGFDVWLPPNFFCKLYWGADLTTSYSTAMHIFSFAILRFISIQHASTFGRITMRMGRIWILCIWIIAFACGFIPFWIFFGSTPGVPKDRLSGAADAKYPACTIILEWLGAYRDYQLVIYPIFIFLPIFGVIVTSVLIARAVHLHTQTSIVSNDKLIQKRVRKEKQAVLQLILIVFSFLFGYIPFAVYEMWSVRSNDAIMDYWFGLVQYFCLRFSECLNPVFYNASSSKMRRETKRFLQKYFRCIVTVTVTSSSEGRISATTSGQATNDLGV